jgi:hypothetical protein
VAFLIAPTCPRRVRQRWSQRPQMTRCPQSVPRWSAGAAEFPGGAPRPAVGAWGRRIWRRRTTFDAALSAHWRFAGLAGNRRSARDRAVLGQAPALRGPPRSIGASGQDWRGGGARLTTGPAAVRVRLPVVPPLGRGRRWRPRLAPADFLSRARWPGSSAASRGRPAPGIRPGATLPDVGQQRAADLVRRGGQGRRRRKSGWPTGWRNPPNSAMPRTHSPPIASAHLARVRRSGPCDQARRPGRARGRGTVRAAVWPTEDCQGVSGGRAAARRIHGTMIGRPAQSVGR